MTDTTDDLDIHDDERDDSDEVRCNRCRERGLYWHQRRGKWILVDEDNVPHTCNNDRAADDFEVLT